MPAVAKSVKRNDVERRIHFYRADCGTDNAGKPVPFRPAAAFAYINGLNFTPFIPNGGRYYEDGENVYCCWVTSRTKVQFAVIRRTALPTIEEKGIVKALNISATAGLVEQIHVRIFPDNIVGFDFNFYGPRLPRLGTYLNVVAKGKADPVGFEPLLRQDAAKDLASGKELRMFALRIRKSHIATITQANKSLGAAFQAIANVTTAPELEVIVRPAPYSGHSIGASLMATARKLAKRKDLREIASEFRVKIASPGGAAEHLDLLGDHFIFDSRILRHTAKGRALDASDAYTKIEAAYASRRDELKKAAALATG